MVFRPPNVTFFVLDFFLEDDFFPQSTKEGILILTDEQLHGHMGAL